MNLMIKNNLNWKEKIYFHLKNLNGITIETNLKNYLKLIKKIEQYNFTKESDLDLKKIAQLQKQQAKSGKSLDSLLPKAYALVNETVKRVLGLNVYRVQLATAIALHQGKLAQMKTGEGKTLAIVFCAYLNARTGNSVHILTANDYLAKRDALWMSKVYEFLNISVGFVQETMSVEKRKKQYQKNITYLTAKQGGFDFLNDSLQYDSQNLMHKGFDFVIVDEADFIMIDEARNPLIIANKSHEEDIDPIRINKIIHHLKINDDFQIDKKNKNCFITEAGHNKVQQLLKCGGIHEEQNLPIFSAVHVALYAHYLLKLDLDYIIKEDKIKLVDQFTGRIAEGRKWPYGIQTALEAKENLPIQKEGIIYGTITIQNYINLYKKKAALTATAISAALEFQQVYNLTIVMIPPNKPDQSIYLPDQVYSTKKSKLEAIIKKIKEVHSTGRPLLIGTKSIEESQNLSKKLSKENIQHHILNAKNDEKEAEIISKAGMLGAVTISTNMAGRGTDIRLGGPDGIEKETIIALGGLFVIGMHKHDSERIDNQLRGRAGRQGDPGASCFYISLEDDIVQNYGIIKYIPKKYLDNHFQGPIDDNEVIDEINHAQRVIESTHYKIRMELHQYQELVEKQRLYIHEIRKEALINHNLPEDLQEDCYEKIKSLSKKTSPERIEDILIKLFLYTLDQHWADHLAFIDEIKQGMHLQNYAHKNPIQFYIEQVSTAFNQCIRNIIEKTIQKFKNVEINNQEINLEKEKIILPKSTWTYTVPENALPSFTIDKLTTNILKTILISFQFLIIAPILYINLYIKKILMKK